MTEIPTSVWVAGILAIGTVLAAYLARKIPQEKTAITVAAGEDVVIMATTLAKSLRDELTVAQGKIASLESKIDPLVTRIAELEAERDRLRITAADLEVENQALRERVGLLELDVSRLTNGHAEDGDVRP